MAKRNLPNLSLSHFSSCRLSSRLVYCLLLIACCSAAQPLHAQGNYEIQVYGSDTVSPGSTMVELHSNYTVAGTKAVPGRRFAADGTEPTTGAEHETVEITQGFNDWFETGFYIFTSAHSGFGYEWVGDHIRPRFRIPEKWHWPVGVSLSNEFGYQRARFSPDTWTWEIRPIVDKTIGPWYLSFNPTLDRSWHGPSVSKGVEFSPNFKFSYDVTKKIAAGLEYYGDYGDLTGFDPFRDQEQDFFPAIDLNVSPKWEFNFGVGVGVTHSTDHLIVKGIIGRRFSFHRHHGS
ncbi:MAG TPA: hypothetical protein VFQ00_13225 [Terriglobales bacterium]|nr:hypothetical protein [Terriglobales bacterium]